MQAAALLVFLVLPVAVVAVSGIALSALLKEAFAPSRTRRPGAARLPLPDARSLRCWAADLSKSLVDKYTGQRWTRASAAAAARDVESEASLVIDHIKPDDEPSYRARCRDRGDAPVFVTVPEVAAIVEELRTKTPGVERQRVLKNVHASTDAAPGGCTRLCPLLGDDGRCIVYGSRPLQCRGWSCSTAETSPGKEPPGKETAAGRNGIPAFSRTVSDGMREGLSSALTASGLDGRAIELNHALAQALDEPDLLDRWAQGEAVAGGQ